MGWLMAIGFIMLLFGVILISPRNVLAVLSSALNAPLAAIDGKLRAHRVPAGVGLTLIGGWMVSAAFRYPRFWFLHVIGAAAIFLGLLYLFLPAWPGDLYPALSRVLLSTDEAVIAARKSLGIILVISAIYVFYSVYLALK